MIYKDGLFEGERALYHTIDATIENSKFANGESPLKESKNIKLNNCIFDWKYPLWYCNDVDVINTKWNESARSGIWYTNNITIKDSIIEAPKQFRRCNNITLLNTNIPFAQETMWGCKNINIKNSKIAGDYLMMNCENIEVDNMYLDGNYVFDGSKNIVVRNSILNSKDSFWNCENAIVYDSTIIGEYLGWNSKNLKFINCTIESNQGMCYIDTIEMINCRLIKTDLCFEFCSNINATICSDIISVKNPISGYIKAKKIGEIILDKNLIDPSKTIIEEE